jgi:hypothetical protein
MRRLTDWLFTSLILALGTASVLTEPAISSDRIKPELDAELPATWPAFVPALEPEPAPAPSLPRESWCEPIELMTCTTSCAPAPDGTARHCVEQWWGDAPSLATAAHKSVRVCVVGYPTRATQLWRALRLRVLVDEICRPSDGCDPDDLHAYVLVLAGRETTLRPYKVHRLSQDVDANKQAWAKYNERYIAADNPAAREPERWTVGRGYYGMNAAAWLWRWDSAAIPEALCGEVEATLTHLRAARERWDRLTDGVECDGEQHFGTATGERPSWYDISLVNSGSNACPATEGKPLVVREGFEKRARGQGINPYGAITRVSQLGRDVPRNRQIIFAAEVRAKMDALYPLPTP